MYYNRILRVWVIDPWDYCLLGAIIGSFSASYLKKYLSEKAAMERLKNSIIAESTLVKSNKPISKKAKTEKFYRFALNNRGGQLEPQPPEEIYRIAQQIQQAVERLATFLKHRELKGIARFFLKNGRLVLELLLVKCRIDFEYVDLGLFNGPDVQFMVLTRVIPAGATAFTISWFSVGATLVAPPLLISALFLRSATQQLLNQRDYRKFKKMIKKLLEDREIQGTLRAIFIEGESPILNSEKFGKLEMRSIDFDKDFILKHDFNTESYKNFEEFMKDQVEKKFGLIENPTEKQLENIIQKRKGKTVFFKDFINKTPYKNNDLVDSDIIDAEILEKSIRIKSDNRNEL